MLVNLDAVLGKAQKEHYAVGLFNTTDTDMLQAAIEAAEALSAPIIIGTAEVLLPHGDLPLIAPSVIAAAKRAAVPVVVHYDHGLTFERCIEALQLGFSSIMFDGSALPYAENCAATAEMVRIAHACGATVEGEIGHVGEAAADEDAAVTTVEEAERFLAATGVDALAVAVGTAHGAYKRPPKLHFDRLRDIRASVDAPLVLHGGSGLSDSDFQNAIAAGIAKVNIFTDLCKAGDDAVRKALDEGLSYLAVRDRKVDAVREAVKRKIRLFGAENKA